MSGLRGHSCTSTQWALPWGTLGRSPWYEPCFACWPGEDGPVLVQEPNFEYMGYLYFWHLIHQMGGGKLFLIHTIITVLWNFINCAPRCYFLGKSIMILCKYLFFSLLFSFPFSNFYFYHLAILWPVLVFDKKYMWFLLLFSLLHIVQFTSLIYFSVSGIQYHATQIIVYMPVVKLIR